MPGFNPQVNIPLNQIIQAIDTPADLSQLDQAKVEGVAAKQIASISDTLKEGLSGPVFKKFITRKDAKALHPLEVGSLSRHLSNALDAEKSNTANNTQQQLLDEIRHLPTDVVQAFSPESFASFSTKVLLNFPAESIRNLPKEHYKEVMKEENNRTNGSSDPIHKEYQELRGRYRGEINYEPPSLPKEDRPYSPDSVTKLPNQK